MTDGTIIFGGTFDPVHNGHLIIARAVAEAVGAGRVMLIPTAVNPLKSPSATSPEDRLEMLRLAVEGDELFEINDYELTCPPPSYTFNTIQHIIQQGTGGGDVSFVVGADMIADLPKWYKVTELLDMARLLVACRPPWTIEAVRDEIAQLKGKLPDEQVDRLTESVVVTPLVDISSTEIRQRASQGLSLRYLVPQPVADYIEQRKLYQ